MNEWLTSAACTERRDVLRKTTARLVLPANLRTACVNL